MPSHDNTHKKDSGDKPVSPKQEKKARAAQEEVMQDLFQDLYKDRKKIYKINFVRGITFGLGSVIGGTVIIAILIWLLTQFVDIPGIGEYFERLLRVLEQTPPTN